MIAVTKHPLKSFWLTTLSKKHGKSPLERKTPIREVNMTVNRVKDSSEANNASHSDDYKVYFDAPLFPFPGDKISNNDNNPLIYCDVCNKPFKDERQHRLHKANIHIKEEGLLVGIKRDKTFMIKSDSLSPIRKRLTLEPKSKI